MLPLHRLGAQLDLDVLSKVAASLVAIPPPPRRQGVASPFAKKSSLGARLSWIVSVGRSDALCSVREGGQRRERSDSASQGFTGPKWPGSLCWPRVVCSCCCRVVARPSSQVVLVEPIRPSPISSQQPPTEHLPPCVGPPCSQSTHIKATTQVQRNI